MKKIICPECGEIPFYIQTETVKRYKKMDGREMPYEDTGDYALNYGVIARCPCGQKVRIIDEEDGNGDADHD